MAWVHTLTLPLVSYFLKLSASVSSLQNEGDRGDSTYFVPLLRGLHDDTNEKLRREADRQ